MAHRAPAPVRTAWLIAMLAMASSAAAGAASNDGCSFDQEKQDRALAKLVARHPGGEEIGRAHV